MPRSWRRVWAVVALGGGLLLGCESTGLRDGYPPDPLFLRKQPVEAKADTAAPAIVHNEPPVPLVPAVAMATVPRDRLAALMDGTGQHADGPAAPRRLPEALPTSATKRDKLSLAPPPSRPVVVEEPPSASAPKPVPGNFGHAPDYTWLQGVLDKRYLAHSDLHYNDSPMEDTFDGRVCLDPDPRLASFHDGDVIFVQGEIVRERGKAVRDPLGHYARYHLRSIELVRHADSRPLLSPLVDRLRKEGP